MQISDACELLNATRSITLKYSGRERVVEIHAAGYTREDKPIMRVWQVRGGSASGDSSGWKLLRLDEITSVRILDEKSAAPRPGYRKGDPAIAKIVCEV